MCLLLHRSVGCIIIELLTGKPPYYDLPAMAALFRIVQDDYPPFPESISQALRDFLLLCFQKEPMMRASAAKLLEHPWLYNSSTNSNLAQTSRLLKSKSISSGEENNDADSIVAAIKMYQQVVSPHPSDISSSSVGESMKMEAKKILAAESIDDHANTNANPFQRALSRSPKKSMESFSGSPATSKKYRRDLGVASSADTVSAGNAVPFSMIFSTSAAEPDNSQGIGIVPSADSTIVGGAFVSERPPTAKRAGSPQKGLNLNPEYYDDGYEAEVRSKTSKSHSRASSRASDSGLIDADMERSYSPTLSDSTADTRDVMDRSRSTSTTATAIPQPIPDFTPRSAGNFFNGMDMHKIADADDDWDDIMVDSGITMSMESVDRGRRPVSASRNTNSRRFESSPPFNQSISYSHADGSPDGMGGAIMNMNSRIPVTRSNSRSSGSKASLSNSISASSISLPHSNRSLASSNGKSDDSKKGTMMRGSDDTDIMNDPLLKIKENRGSASYLLSVPSSYMLTRYQEDPEEESFDDLMHMENVPTDTRTGNATRGTSKNVQKFASVDEQDVYDDFFNDDTVSPPMIPSKMKLASASSSSMDSRYNADFRLLNLKQSTLPALSPVRENSFGLESQSAGENDDFDDGFEPSFESNALASKLRQRMKEATKEVTEEEFDDFLNYQFDEKDFKQNEQKDVHFRRSRDVVDIMGKIRPETKESKVKSLCDDLINIFNTYPEQRDHLITYHGVMPIIDMFEARADAKHKYENIVKLRPYVLRVINKIIEGSSRVQEQLSLVGLIPTVMTLFENSYKTTYLNFGSSSSKSLPSTPHEPAGLLRTSSLYSQTSFFGVVDDNDVDPVTLEAAKFIHQISSTSSLTLQMLIGAGGLSVLTSMVSFGTFIATPMSPVTTIDYNNSPLRKSFQNLALSESTNNNVNEHNVESAFSFVEDKMKPTITIPGSTDTNSNCMTIFQMGIDCITQVFSVQSSRTRDFCRLFVKLGLLPHLATAFQNLMTIYQTQISQSVVQYSMNCMSTTGSTAIGHSQTSSGQLPEGIAAESSSQIANIAPFDNPTKFTASALKAHGARLHRRVESDSNRSESSMNTAAFLNEADDGAERKYCKAVATLLFKFSRSDAVVAETMVSSKFGVITVIINILRSPELRSINDNPSSTTVSLGNTIGSIESLTPRTIPGSSPGDRRSKHIISSGIYLSPAYIEIIELLLKCLKNLSMEPSVLGDLEEAGAINTLIPLLSGPISDKCINHVLPCIFNMCRINKKRQEQAAVLGIVPHLKKLVTDGSHLRQFALPILFDLAHTSAATRAELWKYDIVVFYLDQLKESYWQTFALNSLNIW